jgi:hypothetical protein
MRLLVIAFIKPVCFLQELFPHRVFVAESNFKSTTVNKVKDTT